MAYIKDPLKEKKEEEKRQKIGQPLGGSAPITPAPATPGASGQPATPQSRRQSGSFTNLQKYLKANQGSALGSKVAGGIQQDLSKGQQELAGEKYKTFEQIKSATPEYRPELVRQALATAGRTDPISKQLQDEYAQYEKKFTEGYQGPTGLNQEQSQKIQDLYNKLREKSELTKSEQGRTQLLEQTFQQPDYTSGQKRLDQLLLQLDPEARAQFESTRQAVENAPSQYQQTQEELAKAAQAQQAAYQTGLEQIQKEKGVPITPAQQVQQPVTQAPAQAVVPPVQTPEQQAQEAQYQQQLKDLIEKNLKQTVPTVEGEQAQPSEVSQPGQAPVEEYKPIVDPAVLKYAEEIDKQLASKQAELDKLRPELEKAGNELRAIRQQQEAIDFAKSEIDKAKAGKPSSAVKGFNIRSGTYYTVRGPDGKLYTNSYYGVTKNGEQANSLSLASSVIGPLLSAINKKQAELESPFNKLQQEISNLQNQRPILPSEGDLKQQFTSFQDTLNQRVQAANDLMNKTYGQVEAAFADGILTAKENPELYEAITGKKADAPDAFSVSLPSNIKATDFIKKPTLSIANLMTNAEKQRYLEFAKLTQQEGLPITAETQVGNKVGTGVLDFDRAGATAASKQKQTAIDKQFSSKFDELLRQPTSTKVDGSGRSLLDDFDTAYNILREIDPIDPRGSMNVNAIQHKWRSNRDTINRATDYFVKLANELTDLANKSGKTGSLGQLDYLPSYNDIYNKSFANRTDLGQGFDEKKQAAAAKAALETAMDRISLLKKQSGLYEGFNSRGDLGVSAWTGEKYR